MLERVLERFDYRLVDNHADPAGLASACALLKKRGFSPRTVLDVGVGRGTPWLYEAFPQAHFELFEAIDSFAPMIAESTRGLDARVHFCALGEVPGTLTIDVNRETPTSSTMASYDADYLRNGTAGHALPAVDRREVQVRTLDEFGPFVGPVLLKLDVEGFEAHVLRGAARVLTDVDVVISEVSVVRRTQAELSLAGYLGLLESLGFSMINIAEISPMKRGGPIAYMDLVFVRSNSALRY